LFDRTFSHLRDTQRGQAERSRTGLELPPRYARHDESQNPD
jgi:hypothetical protein